MDFTMSDRPTSFCALIKPGPVQSPLHSNSSLFWLAVSVVLLLFGTYCTAPVVIANVVVVVVVVVSETVILLLGCLYEENK